MKIHLADSEYWPTLGKDFEKQLVADVKRSYEDAAALLPFGSPHVNILVQPREYDLIKATHDAARTINSTLIVFAFSPKHYAKVAPAARKQGIRASVFHEMNHAARFNLGIQHSGFLEWCIFEGLGTAFERDNVSAKPLWADYPPEVAEWLDEVRERQVDVSYGEYMYAHPDGRKYIGYKVGTYIADQAVQKSGKTVADLTQVSCAEILNLAEVA